MQMRKQRQWTAWGTGINPKMDAKCTLYMFKGALSKTNEIHLKKIQIILLPILRQEKY
jgi:hypothetical protein